MISRADAEVRREGREGFTTAVVRLSERHVPIFSLKGCEFISPGQSEAPPWVTVHPEIGSPVGAAHRAIL